MIKKIQGKELDHNTRCHHYNKKQDIIAIQFKCCHQFYACYECHQEIEKHPALRWPKEEFNNHAILCGNCHDTLSIHQYMNSNNHCPHCQAEFNPKCQNHWHLYFDTN